MLLRDGRLEISGAVNFRMTYPIAAQELPKGAFLPII